MKTILALFLVLLCYSRCLAYNGLQPYNSATMHYEVSPAQAISICQAWSGTPSLSLTLTGVIAFDNSPGQEEYIFNSPDHQKFIVNCHSGFVSRWSNGTGYNTYQSLLQQNQNTQLPQYQLEQSAQNFARIHFPNFWSLNMHEQSYNNGLVIFRSQTANGIWIDGPICSINMDTFTGQVYGYSAETVSISIAISTVAALTIRQAEGCALGWLQSPNQPGDPVLSVFTTQPSELWIVHDNFGQQRLVWMVYAAESTYQANYTYNLWVQNNYDDAESCNIGIDANTGEVATYEGWLGGKAPSPSHLSNWHSLSWDSKKNVKHTLTIDPKIVKAQWSNQHLSFQLAGSDNKLMYPPIQMNRQPYFYAAYLCYGSSGAKITAATGKQFTINAPTRYVIINIDSLTYKVNGQTKRMSAKPILANGRCYVPLDVMNAVLPGKFTYDAKTLTVRYDPPQTKPAKAKQL